MSVQDPTNDARLLVVDDEEPIRRMLVRSLEGAGYVCDSAADVDQAKCRLAGDPIDLVLADVHMPRASGLELLGWLRPRAPHTAVVMVTSEDDPRLAETALDLGAYGWVVKPFSHGELLINVHNALRRRRLELENHAARENLERTVAERTAALAATVAELRAAEQEVRASHEETIMRLALAAEFRDDDTAEHVERMSRASAYLGKLVGFSAERCELLRLAAPMHDVGKIGIPDAILHKPGPLTKEERAIMERHTEIGRRILSGSRSALLELGALIAWTHHEKVDGTGYPRRLKGPEIPIEARIVAICDVFDALATKRVYKPAMALPLVVDYLRTHAGRHFDPELVDLFLAHLDEVLEVTGLRTAAS